MNNEATLIEYRWIQFPLHYNVIFDSVNYNIYFLFFKLPMGSIFFSFSLSKAISVMHFSVFMHSACLFPLSDITTKLNHKWYTQNENTYHIRCLNSLFVLTLLEDLPLGIMLITLHVQKCRPRIKGLVLACL